jgi:hypothetical protein
LRILRYPSITEQQFSGCVTAFVDSLSGELNSATIALRRLEGRNKGSAFAYEMTLDTHRYGALIVLDRWGTLLRAFGPHLKLASKQSVIAEGPTRVTSAETILTQANHLLDAGDWYSPAVVEACTLAVPVARRHLQRGARLRDTNQFARSDAVRRSQTGAADFSGRSGGAIAVHRGGRSSRTAVASA